MSEKEPEEVVEEIVEEVVEEAPETPEPDEYEARAKRMGWVPEDQFRGDKAKWVDAKTFVEKGENELPILRERLRKADEGLKELGDLKETVKEFRGYMSDVEKRAYERAKRDLEHQRKEAKEAGDFDKYETATSELHKLETEAKPKAEAEKPPKPDPLSDPVFSEWVGSNDWMRDDPERSAYAESYGAYLNRVQPHLRGKAFLDKVTEAVKKEFPEKFENPRRNGTPKVEGNAGNTPRKPSGKTFNDLPPEAKAACVRYEKQGLLKREDYVKDFFAE